MKTEPTTVDRFASGAFTVEPGMRAWVRYGFTRNAACRWQRLDDDHVRDGRLTLGCDSQVDAFDMDDAATIGCALAQVRLVAHLPGIICTLHVQWSVYWPLAHRDGYYIGEAKTEGGALVAAMRQLTAPDEVPTRPESTAPRSEPGANH